MALPTPDVRSTSELRRGQLIWHFDAKNDVATLRYKDLVLETEADLIWYESECVAFWTRFHPTKGKGANVRKDLLVDLDGILVKPAVASGWNGVRQRMAEKYIGKTYRFGGERRTMTAIHLGTVLQKMEGTHFPDREHALAALLADRAASGRPPPGG